MPVSIRVVQQGDKHAWLGLWKSYNQFYKRTVSTESTDTTFNRFLDDKFRMYGAVAVDSEANKLVGFVHWYPHCSTSEIQEVVYLHDMFVDPNVRGGGIGRKLIEHVYKYAKDLPASSVYWHTQYYNHIAQILYTKVAERTDFVTYSKTV